VGVEQKQVDVVAISPPPEEQRAKRNAEFPADGAKKGRYDLPASLDTTSPVGFRTRLSMTEKMAQQALQLLALERPKAFVKDAVVPTEQALFEEVSLGILTARQSTNYVGHKDIILGPSDSRLAADILRQLKGNEAPVLDNATHTHIVLSRPYRTPFTMLLTFIGHKPVVSLATVAIRGLRKRIQHVDDIPTIGYLQQLHIGILADQMERAAVIASAGRQQAQVFMRPFAGEHARTNQKAMRKLEELIGLSAEDRVKGWRVATVAQVGEVATGSRVRITANTLRRLGANLLAFRSERIQPGVNQEEKAPDAYQIRQDMDVPDELTVMAGRAGYNAFIHWTGVDREIAKRLLLLERIDVLTPNGKDRIREVRAHLDSVTDKVIANIPLWADLPTGKALSRNAARGKKAFALAGQRIYMGGLDQEAIKEAGIDWVQAVRAFGAASARGALVAELMGVVDLPDDCDLLAGICLMAGPVNQNDIGKSFYGEEDLLQSAFPNQKPTSLLFWTLKAKTVADPIGNEEQLMNATRKGALVDLRPGPHEVVSLRLNGKIQPMRNREGRINAERAFSDMNNFVTDPYGVEIPGNRGSLWPDAWRNEKPW